MESYPRRELDATAGRVLVASGKAKLWIIGRGILPLRYNQNGSITFPDHDAGDSKAYDEYLTYFTDKKRRSSNQEKYQEQRYRQGYLERWNGAIEAMMVLMRDENRSSDEAYSECLNHLETELIEWQNASGSPDAGI